MNSMKYLALAAACASLAACGGGGDGVASTPTPPAPPPAPNTSLLAPLGTETFVNDATTGNVNYPKTDEYGTATSGPSTLTISYDAPSSRYTVSTTGRSQTFTSSNIDTALSNAQIAVYKKVNGKVTDTLTLTKPGTSGALTYKYVGAGFWQQTTDGSTAVSGTLDSFTYGVKTPDASVPRTGNASYSIDLLGTMAWGDTLMALRGNGTMTVDFAASNLNFTGNYYETNANTGGTNGPNQFGGAANLSTSANALSGKLFLHNGFTPPMVADLTGRFYGPGAEEVGAAWNYADPISKIAGTGTITGRKP